MVRLHLNFAWTILFYTIGLECTIIFWEYILIYKHVKEDKFVNIVIPVK